MAQNKNMLEIINCQISEKNFENIQWAALGCLFTGLHKCGWAGLYCSICWAGLFIFYETNLWSIASAHSRAVLVAMQETLTRGRANDRYNCYVTALDHRSRWEWDALWSQCCVATRAILWTCLPCYRGNQRIRATLCWCWAFAILNCS